MTTSHQEQLEIRSLSIDFSCTLIEKAALVNLTQNSNDELGSSLTQQDTGLKQEKIGEVFP
jgi:hypothetical protein